MLLNSGEQKYFSPPKTFPRLAECLTSWESDSEICLQDLKDLSLQWTRLEKSATERVRKTKELKHVNLKTKNVLRIILFFFIWFHTDKKTKSPEKEWTVNSSSKDFFSCKRTGLRKKKKKDFYRKINSVSHMNKKLFRIFFHCHTRWNVLLNSRSINMTNTTKHDECMNVLVFSWYFIYYCHYLARFFTHMSIVYLFYEFVIKICFNFHLKVFLFWFYARTFDHSCQVCLL